MINYNYSRYIERAVATILAQSYIPCEFIVIDDCSTDDSVARVERLLKDHPYCRLVVHSHNKGVLYTLQEALHIASGTHIYLASSDDYVEPGFFRKTMEIIEKNPEVGICCGKAIYFRDEEENARRIHHHLGIEDEIQIIKPDELPLVLRKSNFSIAGVTSIYRRDLMLKYGGFKPNLKSTCDGFLIYQIAFQHPVAYIPVPFAAVREHSSSYSAGILQSKTIREEIFKELLRSLYAEGEQLVNSFRSSGVLLYFGKPFLLYLCRHVKHWHFLFSVLVKQFNHKKNELCKRIKNKH
jgi:glycosyltransferase involved in cell wall biosynthesis